MRLGLVTAVVVLGGCGSEEDSPGVPASSGALSYRPCDQARRVGGFAVNLLDGYTAVQGSVKDAVVPTDVREVKGQAGVCRHLAGRNLVCDPGCGASQTCSDSRRCIATPTNRNVGAVRVEGVGAPLTLQPSSVNSYFVDAMTWPAGDVTLRAPGGQLPGFTLRGQAVHGLVRPAGAVTLQRGKPLVLTWTAAPAQATARIRAVVALGKHGGIVDVIECDDVPDTGRLEIAAPLVDQLTDVGLAGFPTATIQRRTADSVDLAAGCVELTVVSEVVVEVDIGLMSCSDDSQCPAGQTCQRNSLCR